MRTPFVLTDRVEGTGEQVDRQGGGHPGDVVPVIDVGHHPEEVGEERRRRDVAAPRVGDVLVDLLLVAAEPVELGPVGLERVVVPAEGHGVQQSAACSASTDAALGLGHKKKDLGQHARVTTGSGEHEPINVGPEPDGVRPRED